MPRFVTLIALLLACARLSGQNGSAHAQSAVEAIQQLRAIGLPDIEGGQTGPPARVPGLLRQLNQQLRALITETLNDRRRLSVPSQAEIIEQLQEAGWDEIASQKWNAYGELRQIGFDWKEGYDPGILVVSTQLWIPCGSSDPDSVIYVFQGRAREWKLVLATDADFDTTGDLQESGMQYQLSPPDAHGEWFLAIAHSPPACGPTAASLRYTILRPGRSADEPRILFDHRVPLDDKFKPPFRLQVEDDWFALTRGKERKLDGDAGVSIERYEISGDQVRRLQPLALTPEDFLDEWVRISWDEAARWSSQSSDADLSKWHSRLNALAYDSTEIEFVQPCPQQPSADRVWLTGLWIDQKLNPASADERLYISVSERKHAFFVDSVQTSRPPGCPGKARQFVMNWTLPEW
ncbi:MAG TPA: hypothetical protein VK812_04000 [Candidatus Binatus sp.]|nr:hypothetical protein [Candidatus Binatus sp.]